MRVRVFVVSLLVAFLAIVPGAQLAMAALPAATEPVATEPPPTVNPFLPEDRSIGDCISAVPKPGCGSEAAGGWHQYLVAIALVGGLAFIGWRIVAGGRRSAKRSTE